MVKKNAKSDYFTAPAPRNKRVLEDVIIVQQKKEIAAQLFKSPPPTIKTRPPNFFRQKKYIFLCLAIIAAALGALVVFGFLKPALEVAVSVKQFQIPITKTLELSKNDNSGLLLFKTFETPYSLSDKFLASESASSETKASGVVVVFNKSRDAQVLIASTRLEAPNKKIYRMPKTIVVPAAALKGGELQPGSKEVTVYADQPGEDSNSSLTDFTFPGLKGSAKYDLVFARSKTEITGGASGKRIVVGKTDEAKAEADLLSKARSSLKIIASDKLPEDQFLLAPSLEYIVENKNVDPPIGSAVDAADNKFSLALNGKARGIFVSRDVLEKALVGDRAELAPLGNSFSIANLDGLVFNLAGYNFDAQDFRAQVSGTANVEYKIDENQMANFIKTNKLYTASSILSAFPGLSRVEVRLKPFWLGFFGSEPRGIDIILQGS